MHIHTIVHTHMSYTTLYTYAQTHVYVHAATHTHNTKIQKYKHRPITNNRTFCIHKLVYTCAHHNQPHPHTHLIQHRTSHLPTPHHNTAATTTIHIHAMHTASTPPLPILNNLPYNILIPSIQQQLTPYSGLQSDDIPAISKQRHATTKHR